MKTFVPFHQIRNQKVIIVDGLHPKNLTLSHWKGGNIHPKISADTSAEIVINALQEGIEGMDCDKISATHFDIDGFVGVFALFYPELALQHKELLIQMATIGDFREFNPDLKGANEVLKLCCWMNSVEKKLFYGPFEAKDEIESCVPKFEYFLKKFPDALHNISEHESDWIQEYTLVMNGMKKLHATTENDKHLDIGLLIKRASEPSHYYAQFSNSAGFDIVLSCYDDNRYELEYKYTTWVDIVSRPSFPRIDLQPLVQILNKKEKSDCNWQVDKITDTGPILRLEKHGLNKAERYANPSERIIYPSSISENQFRLLVIEYFKSAYAKVSARKFWSWNEMKSL